jgi:hypothetical protein
VSAVTRSRLAVRLIAVLVVILSFVVASPTPVAMGAPHDFAAGGGQSGVKFQFVAHAEGDVPGPANGHMRVRGLFLRGVFLDFRAEVTCLNVGPPRVLPIAGTAARVEAIVLPGSVGVSPGRFFDLDVVDSGQPGGRGDEINFAGGFELPQCLPFPPLGFGGTLDHGNIVVRDASEAP